MSRPTVSGNTKPERTALLRSVGCPEHLLAQADRSLRSLVTPVKVRARRPDDGSLVSRWAAAFELGTLAARVALKWAVEEPDVPPCPVRSIERNILAAMSGGAS